MTLPRTGTGLAFTLVILGALPGCFRQKQDEWSLQNDAGLAALAQGNYPQAESHFAKAVAEAEKSGAPDRRLADSVTSLAWTYDKQKKPAEAASAGERAVTIFKDLNGDADPDKARCLYMLARLYQRQKKLTEAENLFKQAQEVAKDDKAFGAKNTVVAQIESDLGALYDAQGRFDEAEPLHASALQILKEAPSKKDHTRIASCYENSANHYRLKGDFTKAAASAEKAVDALKTPLKKSDPRMMNAVQALATLQAQQGGKQAESAKKLLTDAVETLRTATGDNKLALAQVLHGLGTVAYERNEYKEAEKYLNEALLIRKKELGENDLHVAATLRSLANLEKASQKFTYAEGHYKEALKIKEAVLGPEALPLAGDLESLASVCKRLEKFMTAQANFKRALAIREKALGPDDRAVAATMHNLANLYRDWKKPEKYDAAAKQAEKQRYADAENLYKKSLAIKEKALGPNHPQVAKLLDNYGQFLAKNLGRESEANELKTRIKQINERNQKNQTSKPPKG